MSQKTVKNLILDRLLRAAAERWDKTEIEKMRPVFEAAAEAVWIVEEFQLSSEEELAYPTTIFYQVSRRRGRERGVS